jgi:hypothetical protein
VSGAFTEVAERARRWEHGSDFPLLSLPQDPTRDPMLVGPRRLVYASGRTALHALLGHARTALNCSRVWIPDYFCQDVVPALRASGMEIIAYPATPFDREITLGSGQRAGDIVLVVDFFGLAGRAPVVADRQRGIVIVEDHTHDPGATWARSSSADWCIASLRKTLPVPDGGLLWSPAGHALPAAPDLSAAHLDAAASKLAAMALKRLYLAGDPVEKSSFRELYARGEEVISGSANAGAASAWTMAMLPWIPLERWRAVRCANHRRLGELLADVPRIEVAMPDDPASAAPVACILVCRDAALRERLRTELVRECIYPAVLWSLEEPAVSGISGAARELSRRVLALHCDMRYTDADLERVAGAVRSIVAA